MNVVTLGPGRGYRAVRHRLRAGLGSVDDGRSRGKQSEYRTSARKSMFDHFVSSSSPAFSTSFSGIRCNWGNDFACACMLRPEESSSSVNAIGSADLARLSGRSDKQRLLGCLRHLYEDAALAIAACGFRRAKASAGKLPRTSPPRPDIPSILPKRPTCVSLMEAKSFCFCDTRTRNARDQSLFERRLADWSRVGVEHSVSLQSAQRKKQTDATTGRDPLARSGRCERAHRG
jgi:hypothetical protein